MLDKSEICEVPSHKLLGVTLDRNMAYDLHIDELCKKLCKRPGLFKHISPYLKQKQRETYFNGVIKPTLMYGSMAWDSCCAKQSLIKRNTLAYKRVDSSRNTPSYIDNLF